MVDYYKAPRLETHKNTLKSKHVLYQIMKNDYLFVFQANGRVKKA